MIRWVKIEREFLHFPYESLSLAQASKLWQASIGWSQWTFPNSSAPLRWRVHSYI